MYTYIQYIFFNKNKIIFFYKFILIKILTDLLTISQIINYNQNLNSF